MRNVRAVIVMLVFSVSVVIIAGTASASDISGTISSTLTIAGDSQLVGDVTCRVTGAPCIAFGASGISLKLNGFSISGNGDAVTGCAGGGVGLEIGIDVNNQRGVIIEGPGIVQHFRGHGIRLFGSTRVLVRLVTVSTNCFAGVIVTGGSDNDLEENIAVRNGNANVPCGGICLNGSSRNRIRANRMSGNGYATQGNNFGIGLVAPGTNDNTIVDNTVVGNANGIILVAGAEGNVVLRNMVVGNPPIQVSVNNPGTAGVDIRDLAMPGANTVTGNVCLTSLNAVCSGVDNPRPRR